jgi:hypothetical protein
MFPYKQECLLAETPKRIGISDSFGRMHWAPRRELKRAIRQYQKDFSTPRVAIVEHDDESVGGGALEDWRADSSSTNAVSLSSARTTKRLPSSR